jgi:light-regulated signal transduction histidine kinase (bacteriophytochrome)
LARGILAGAGLVLLAEEALDAKGIESLVAVVNRQPQWSDLPFVVLTSGGGATGHSRRRSQMLSKLGHVTLLERPIRIATLTASVRAGLSSRARQYEVRNQLTELVGQREELGRSNAALEQFAYAAAHDLKEPLRNVSLYVQLLEEKCVGLDGEGHEFIKEVIEGTDRMHALVEDLLSYTRVLHGTEEADPLADANLVRDQVLESMRSTLQRSGAEIKSELLPQVRVFAPHLYQVMQNLISNALKYRSECTPRVSIGVLPQTDLAHFVVRDNGIGIASDFHDKIFKVFKRLHNRNIPGTGMGLAICQRIVSHYGGQIWVESEVGRGAEFHFTLPKG